LLWHQRDSRQRCGVRWQAWARHRCRLPDGVLWTQLTLPALDSGVADAGWPRHLCRTHSTTLPRQLSAMIVQSLTAQFTPQPSSSLLPASGRSDCIGAWNQMLIFFPVVPP
jgi:hypothetical protein